MLKKIVLLLAFISITLNAQDFKKQNTRNMYIYSGTGAVDLFYIGIGHDFNKNISLAFKTNIFPTNGDELRIANGYGLKFTKMFPNGLLPHSIINIDCLNIETVYGFHLGNRDTNPLQMYINLASEKIDSKGLNFTWALGFGAVFEKDENAYVTPYLKIGLVYNFFN